MKKLITSIAALLLFAGISNAADTNENSAAKSVEKSMTPTSSSTLLSTRTISQIIEENSELRVKVEEISNQAENLNSMLDYSKMMHATISNLNGEIMNEQAANTKSQLDYARMMTTTLLNLNSVALTGR